MKRSFQILSMIVLSLLVLGPLSAKDLSEILSSAKANSPTLKQAQLTRENSKLAAKADTLTDSTSFTVSSGDVTYQGASVINDSSSDWDNQAYLSAITASPSLSLTIPSNATDSTTISLSMDDSGVYSLNNGTQIGVMNPSLSVGHTFTFGKTSDERTTLLAQYNYLLADTTYASSEQDFETSILSNLVEILTEERSIAETTRTIEKAQKTLDDALTLGTITQDSVSAKQQQLSILASRNTLASAEAKRSAAVALFTTLTGLEYDGVTGIGEPDLSFTASQDGNSTVKLKQQAMAIAQENLDIRKAQDTNTTLDLSGGSAWTVSSATGSTNTSSSGSVSVGATLKRQTYSIGLSTGLKGITSSSGTTPFVTVSGSWSNNATKESAQLEILQLQNSVLLAQWEYTTALSDYQSKAASLTGDITNWNLEHQRLIRQLDYENQALEYQQTLYKEGLATQEEIKDAELQVNLATYDISISLLNGLILEQSIATLAS